ncbi:hypothetical protein IEQ34_012447 [Dendrobium chrysotoxum]|uniref:Uncharacterized protein n=1 Tax=Dendrobium chrysotoxum TaxID=161865 RepID=A0AAV7GVF6_DENCH|nr:hypothetical protein IEQ34_012447 [Dendrobium chrysotoxum]
MEPPVRRRKGVCQRPQHPIESLPVAVVSTVKPDCYVSVIGVRRQNLGEIKGGGGRPTGEGTGEDVLKGSSIDGDGGDIGEGVGEYAFV